MTNNLKAGDVTKPKYRYYRGYTIRNHGYYPPDKCIWWEAYNSENGNADFHAHRLRDIIKMIDESLDHTSLTKIGTL